MTQPRRDALAEAFLAQTGWAEASRTVLPQDASTRQYTRLYDAQRGQSALLMNAPPETETKTRSFVDVAEALLSHGLSAPAIYAADIDNGFLLLEDFGTASFTHALQENPERESALYQAAGGVIERLNGLHLDTVPPYDTAALQKELDVFCDHWWPDAFGEAMPEMLRDSFNASWAQPLALLEDAAQSHPALTLRDFHVDNLFDLPGRQGPARVGLIDFQDALMGHVAYDLVSLLQDARRDVAPEVESAVLYACDDALTLPNFRAIYAAYGAQRALKILGVFVRLANQHKKPAYRRHLPRTWRCVMMNLGEETLSDLKAWIDAHVPAHVRQAGAQP